MRLVLFIIICLNSVMVFAIDPLLSLKIGKAEAALVALEKSLNNPTSPFDLKLLREFQEQGLDVKKTANECIELNEQSINKSAQDLELLGDKAEVEEKEVSLKRQSLNQSMLSAAQQLASCRLLLLRSHEVIDVSLAKQQKALANELLAKQPDIFQNFKYIVLNPLDFYDASVEFIQTDSGINTLRENLFVLTGLIVIAALFTLLLKRWIKSGLKQHLKDEQKGYLNQFQVSLLSCVNRYLPALLLTGSVSAFYVYQLITLDKVDFLGLVIIGLFLYALFNLVIRIIINPCPPGHQLSSLPQDVSLLLATRLRLLSKLLLIGFLMYAALQLHTFPEQITGMLRNIYLFLLVLNLIWAVWLFRFYESVSNIHFIRAVIIMGLLVSLGADWLGYISMANFILIGILSSMLLWSLTVFILRIWTDFLDSMDEGRHQWQVVFRKRIGVKEKDFIPGSFWFRMTFAFLIWSAFIVGLLKIWGLPDASFISLRDSVFSGFELGTIKIVPLKFVTAILTFAMLLSIIGWAKRRMDKSWLKHSRMDHASKESMVSLSGYLGVAIAALIGLSIAGVELANVALIAGALSVGIGFGLQNIVNNFISGVILLFERPIKTGDWVVVGGTQGYVKKISIRSTQIQTFDRSDVIVPNSELISTQVTNWMFKDKIGRVIVPIGVAYGSDPQTVKQILLDIAYANPQVITKSPVISKPWVLFTAFGDSSLNFELRCYIKSVDERLSVISDMNFAIEAALRKASIVIPFPQRDVHIISDNDDLIANSDDIKS